MTFLCFTVNYFRQQHLARIDLQSSRIDALDRECVRHLTWGDSLFKREQLIRQRLKYDPARQVLWMTSTIPEGTPEHDANFLNNLKHDAPGCSTLP